MATQDNLVPLPPTGQDPAVSEAVVLLEGGGSLDSDLDLVMGIREHEERKRKEKHEFSNASQSSSYGPAPSRAMPYRTKYDYPRGDLNQ